MADTKASAFTATASVAGTDSVPVLQGGANKLAPLSQVATYVASAINITSTAEAAYAGTVTFTGTTAPTGAANRFAWARDGNDITVYLWLNYTVPGVAITLASCTLPAGLPNPIEPTGFTSTGDLMYMGVGGLATSSSSGFSNNSFASIAKTGVGTYSILIKSASTAVLDAYATITYRTT